MFQTKIPVEFLFKRSAKNMDPDVVSAYGAPFPSSLYKGGVARWPVMVPLFKDDQVTAHMEAARNCLRTWKKPALVMFGDK